MQTLKISSEVDSPVIDTRAFNGHPMVGRLKPRSGLFAPYRRMGPAGHRGPMAGISDSSIGRISAPRKRSMSTLPAVEAAGAEVVELAPPPPIFALDAVYAHDASLASDFGLIVMRPGKAEPCAGGATSHRILPSLGIPTFGEITAPGTTEGGDIVWLDARPFSSAMAIGRTQPESVSCGPARAQRREVLPAPLPYGRGPVVLSASDVADQPARRRECAGGFALAGGRNR